MNENLPSVSRLKKLLRYDPETGKLFWLARGDSRFDNRFHGAIALNTLCGSGYKKGRVDYVNVLSHRAAWAIHYGYWPNRQIDHINGDRSDNRILNLRLATFEQNNRNKRANILNSSGENGIYFEKSRHKYCVRVSDGKKKLNLGRFLTIDEAISVRDSAYMYLGYSERHGK